jgi:galactokinase
VHCFFSLISKPAAAMDEITMQLLGELMYQSHLGYSQCGLGTESTDKLVDLVRAEKANGLVGAKVTGGGAGGTVAVLGMNAASSVSALRRVVDQFGSWSGLDPFLFEGSSAGCDRFGVLQVRY